MKVIFKSAVLGEDLSDLFIPVIYDWKQLAGVYGSDDDKDADMLTGKLISYLKDVLEKPGEKDYRKVELGFEKFYSKVMAEVAAGLTTKMISEFLGSITIPPICRDSLSPMFSKEFPPSTDL